jgi:alpha-tubulin suppressor-like RCC1 family protein
VLSNTHCGRCGNACAAGTVCDAGRCVTAARSTVAQVVLGRAHGCARYANGRVRCWGTGAPGPRVSSVGTPSAPVDTGLDAVTQLSSGADHVCALRSDASLWCWGRNDLRQLNDGTTAERASPTLALREVAEVAAGDEFTCARRTNGEVTCWGSNSSGQFGPSVSADGRYGTVAAPGNPPVTQIAAGRGHACLRTARGEAFCWGRCDDGQAGGCFQGARADLRLASLNVAELSLAGNISALRRNDGTVLTWGNAAGGTEMSRGPGRPTPTAVSLPATAVQIAAGPLHVCARLTDGRVMCWGRGDVERSATPRAALSDMSATQLAVGAQNACVTRPSDGMVQCWGSGDGGMMLPSGDGRAAPTPRAMTLL